MSSKVEKLAMELLGLPASARAELAEKLILSLDDSEDHNVEPLWVEEAQRRLSEIHEGEVHGEPAERALRDVTEKLKSR